MSVPASRVEVLVWALIYGGLFAVGIGVSLERSGQDFGWGLIVLGATLAIAGTVLIWVRSRMSAGDVR